jgi:hypothetical protein
MMARLRHASAWRDWSAFAALLALIIQMSVAVAHDPLEGALGWGVPLCHAGGASAGHPAAPAPPAGAPLCPVCVGLAACSAAVLPPPVLGAPMLAFAPVPVVFRAAASEILAYPPVSTAQPRAPPALA